ncbi:hypothetical protein [Deminuibacter soli]|uniref:DUF1080 domain-containing protein n=1 Tax=Deminuibacter soli TaxID=2291815 RepID=A0A3E1NQC8_9BACT|nr:hypothetical protein [Deminuibacter soli]RFM30136.1 hypothetical protein DXN05_03955 [Deminuibacter soli]
MHKHALTYAAALLLLTAPFCSKAQNTVDQVNNTADKVNSTVDKVGGWFKKKNKNKKDTTVVNPANNTQATGTNITINSNYDFTPGSTVIFEDNFDSTHIGGFPHKWLTNGSGEVVTLDQYPGKWLNTTNNSVYIPKIKGGISKDFTVEFDVIVANRSSSVTFKMDFEDALNNNYDIYPSNNAYLQVRLYDPNNLYLDSKNGNKDLNTNASTNTFNSGGKVNHIAIRKTGERFQLYVNKEKAFDVNKAFDGTRTYSTFKFESDLSSPTGLLVSNFKITQL